MRPSRTSSPTTWRAGELSRSAGCCSSFRPPKLRGHEQVGPGQGAARPRPEAPDPADLGREPPCPSRRQGVGLAAARSAAGRCGAAHDPAHHPGRRPANLMAAAVRGDGPEPAVVGRSGLCVDPLRLSRRRLHRGLLLTVRAGRRRATRSLRTDLARDALEMAIRSGRGEQLQVLVYHSDRGVNGGLTESSGHRFVAVTGSDR